MSEKWPVLTLPRLGSRVRFASPAPKFPLRIKSLVDFFGAFFCFPAFFQLSGEAWGSTREARRGEIAGRGGRPEPLFEPSARDQNLVATLTLSLERARRKSRRLKACASMGSQRQRALDAEIMQP